MFTDTHCHIHEASYENADTVYQGAIEAGVGTMLCVGTSDISSAEAVRFAENHDGVWASIGVHPHDTKDGYGGVLQLAAQAHPKLVAVGEVGLDYFYTHSPKAVQIRALEAQLQLAVDHELPVIFHVREAFEDFWPIYRNFPHIRGVLHSYTDTVLNLERALGEGLYIGVNGISTFTKDEIQRRMFDAIPLEKMLLETDAPFLTPVPHRGKVNEPAFVKHVAEYHANRRAVELEYLARVTSMNASKLFSFN